MPANFATLLQSNKLQVYSKTIDHFATRSAAGKHRTRVVVPEAAKRLSGTYDQCLIIIERWSWIPGSRVPRAP